jgi:hypothetical protein
MYDWIRVFLHIVELILYILIVKLHWLWFIVPIFKLPSLSFFKL